MFFNHWTRTIFFLSFPFPFLFHRIAPSLVSSPAVLPNLSFSILTLNLTRTWKLKTIYSPQKFLAFPTCFPSVSASFSPTKNTHFLSFLSRSFSLFLRLLLLCKKLLHFLNFGHQTKPQNRPKTLVSLALH